MSQQDSGVMGRCQSPLNDERTMAVGAESEHSTLHQFLLVVHFIVAIAVFGTLGRVLSHEVKRMSSLERARNSIKKTPSRRTIEFVPPLAASAISISKPGARTFAAEYALYRADYFLSTASFAKPLLLLVLTYLIIILGGLGYSYLSGISVLEAFWLSWTMVADPGAHGDTQGTVLRTLSLALTLAGMLVFALMIGIVADGVSNFLDSLKQGHAGVVEMEHTLILGWSQKTIPCVRELCLANESLKGRGVIVILADYDKLAMETELKATLRKEDLRGSLVICRSGKVTNENDLKKVSARHARSIIVLADSSISADASDARAVRVVMCLSKIYQESESAVDGHVVVELCDVDNKDLIPLIAPMQCEVVVSHDLIGRMMIVCARQPGLTEALQQMLTFEGAEFYFKNWPQLAGKTFREVSFMFPKAVVLGVKPTSFPDAIQQLENSKYRVDVTSKQKRRVLLNPPDDYIFREDDLLLVLADDDDSYEPISLDDPSMLLAKRESESIVFSEPSFTAGTPEKFLFCGSRRDMDDMILELDQMVAMGSELTLMTSVEMDKLKKQLFAGGLDLNSLKNIKVTFVQGNHILRRDLEKLPLETFSSILILAEEEFESTINEADSRTLTCLLLIRDIISKRKPSEDTTHFGRRASDVDKPSPSSSKARLASSGPSKVTISGKDEIGASVQQGSNETGGLFRRFRIKRNRTLSGSRLANTNGRSEHSFNDQELERKQPA